MKQIPHEARELATQQSGLLSRSQLKNYGILDTHVRSAVQVGHLTPVTSRVVALGTVPQSRQSQIMAVLLHFPQASLTGRAALEMFSFPGQLNERIYFLSETYIRKPPFSYWKPHGRDYLVPQHHRPGVSPIPVAVVDAMRFARSDKEASFCAIWSLQRQLVQLHELQNELSRTSCINGSNRVSRVLRDLRPGINAISEMEFDQLCRKFGLPSPDRQSRRRDSEGRARYLDALWERPHIKLAVEIDGLGHLDYQVRADDMFRDNSMALSGIVTMRIPAQELRREPQRWLQQIANALHINH